MAKSTKIVLKDFAQDLGSRLFSSGKQEFHELFTLNMKELKKTCIFSGVFYGREPALIVGGRAIVCPCIQTIQRLPLSTITLLVQSPKVYTSQGVPISVTGVAQV